MIIKFDELETAILRIKKFTNNYKVDIQLADSYIELKCTDEMNKPVTIRIPREGLDSFPTITREERLT